MQTKKELLASKIALKRRLTNEERLQRELSKFFKKLHKEVQSSLQEYWSEYQMLQGHINLICAPVHEAHREYYEILKKYKLREYELGKREAKRLVDRAGVRYAFKEAKSMPINGFIKKNSNELFGTLPKAEQDLLNRTFKTSERTLSRVDGQLNNIITDGYRSGKGINDIANQVTKRFNQLETWEAKRIARTEVNTAHNKATIDTYKEMGVEYIQWIAASDDRTRDSHVEVDGEIIPIGGKYSNGLEYPGDMSGPIEEWINCRCSNAPFVIPYGYMAPSFSPFREEDLVPVPVVEEPQVIEPTTEQLQSNLTKQEREQYQWAKDVQTSEFISDTGKAKARETLEQLRQKALSGTPKPKSAPKPVEEPVKPKPTPVEPKPTGKSAESMTSQELYDSMTKADKKKYDKFKKKVETADKNIKQLGENPILLDMKKKNLMELRKLEQKQRTKLENKGKRKPKQKPVRTNERTLDNIHKEVEVPTDELIPKLEKWIDKRCKNTSEFGYQFDVETGKIIDGLKNGEIRGKKGGITMSDLGVKTGSIHSHPRNGMSAPSIEDLEVFRCKKQQHHFMVSEHEIWYVKATDNFGIGGMGQQLDLQSAHKACRDRAFETVSKLVKKGKIEATEKALAKALDKYTGDEILKTFNKPPWNKTLTVKRYYR